MPYNSTKVDLSRIPDGDLKNTFIHFAEQHNALVDGAIEMKQDLDQISGTTPEQKAMTYDLLGKVRTIFEYLHGRRFNTALITLQAYIALGILKQMGITPHQFSDLLDAIIGVLRKIYS